MARRSNSGLLSHVHRALCSVRARMSNERGDTLVEALAALLIAALGAALLATMVMVSTNVVAQTRSIQAANFDAESQTYDITKTNSSNVAMTISAEDVSQPVAVTVYTSKDGTFVRYVVGGK